MMNTNKANETTATIDSTASVNKMSNTQRWELLISKVQEMTANNKRLGVTIQEKKRKICVRVYADDSRTKFFNVYEIIFKSRYNSYEIFARDEKYIPNALKDNFYKFHIDYDMKHESVIEENDFHSLGLLLTIAHSLTRATATTATANKEA